ncbi:hypothetical protein LCGC14_0500710 [marine sediment metagenome]|uniref:Uncharacterized protein n=1 Tax=marine sediment metagenome TaxID=412755 RepID=A0A0F9SME9_9ZZZZ|nr:MAG: Tetratricopeptide repeat protein [Candidatus Lokiarchaeum sp. GC14_75]
MNSIRNVKDSVLSHTYSIVARDRKTGEMGVGVQSHYFSVGSVVDWGASGIGVVATQSFVNKSFGLRGLELMKKGKTPEEALAILLLDDDGKNVRQVALLDTHGRVAVHTGSKCIKYAGHKTGENFSVQANMMLKDTVWPAMARAFEKNKDVHLPERIIKTLEAAESEGGDIRGKQSAAILIVKGEPVENKWDDPFIDIRVEDHPEPLEELNRLLKLRRAYELMDKGDVAIEKGDIDKALKEFNSAREICPNNIEMKYWTAISLANNNRLDYALKYFKEIFKADNNWRILTERLPIVDLLNLKKNDLEKILSLK